MGHCTLRSCRRICTGFWTWEPELVSGQLTWPSTFTLRGCIEAITRSCHGKDFINTRCSQHPEAEIIGVDLSPIQPAWFVFHLHAQPASTLIMGQGFHQTASSRWTTSKSRGCIKSPLISSTRRALLKGSTTGLSMQSASMSI